MRYAWTRGTRGVSCTITEREQRRAESWVSPADGSEFLAAFAHYRPVTTNDTPEGRALNRRIDLFLLNPKEGVADSVKDKAKLINKKSKIVNIKKVK